MEIDAYPTAELVHGRSGSIPQEFHYSLGELWFCKPRRRTMAAAAEHHQRRAGLFGEPCSWLDTYDLVVLCMYDEHFFAIKRMYAGHRIKERACFELCPVAVREPIRIAEPFARETTGPIKRMAALDM